MKNEKIRIEPFCPELGVRMMLVKLQPPEEHPRV